MNPRVAALLYFAWLGWAIRKWEVDQAVGRKIAAGYRRVVRETVRVRLQVEDELHPDRRPVIPG